MLWSDTTGHLENLDTRLGHFFTLTSCLRDPSILDIGVSASMRHAYIQYYPG
jgi:hypothetical protein